MKKLLMLSAFAVLGLTACKTNRSDDVVRFSMPQGVPSLALLKQINEKDNIIRKYHMVYQITDLGTLTSDVNTKKTDIAIVPSTLAAKQHNDGIGYQIIGTVGFGSFYLVSKDTTVNSYAQFEGKTICAWGGANNTPAATLKEVLSIKGVTATINAGNSLEAIYTNIKRATSESDACYYSLVSEPHLSMLIDEGAILESNLTNLSLNDAFVGGFPQSTLIAKKSFILKNEYLIHELIESMKKSIDWLSDEENEEELIDYVTKTPKVGLDVAYIQSVISRANLNFVSATKNSDIYDNYYAKVKDLIGGTVPTNDIYYKATTTNF